MSPNVISPFGVDQNLLMAAILDGDARFHTAISGRIAEYQLERHIEQRHPQAAIIKAAPDMPYDYIINDKRIQVKMQRKKSGRAIEFAEFQRSRNGTNSAGEPTRFYHIDDFDIACVCLFPSTGQYIFKFALSTQLKPHPDYANRIAPMQPLDSNDVKWESQLTSDLLPGL